MSHLHTYTYFAHPIDFFALPKLQKLQIYHVWFLFGVLVFWGAINLYNKMVRKILVRTSTTDIYLH